MATIDPQLSKQRKPIVIHIPISSKVFSIWKVIFSILVIIHVLLFSAIIAAMRTYMGEMAIGIVWFPLGYWLTVITFITVLLFVRKQKPQGVAKYISYTYLIIAGLLLLAFGYPVITLSAGIFNEFFF